MQAGPKNFPIPINPGLPRSPHIHPRANELFFVLGGQVNVGFLLSTGDFESLDSQNPTINGTLKRQEVFTSKSMPPDCKNANTFEAFSSDDPGAILVLNKVSNDSRVLFPQIEPNNLDGLRAVLPPAILREVESCLARCSV